VTLAAWAAGCHLVTKAGNYEIDDSAFGPAPGGAAGGGDAPGGAAGGDGVPEGCVEVVPVADEGAIVSADLDGVTAAIALRTPLGGAGVDGLVLSFVKASSAEFPLGTFDLGANGNASLATCVHCATVLEDLTEEGLFARAYFQTSGSVQAEWSAAAVTGRLVYSNVRLGETDVNGDPMPGGACLFLRSYTWEVSNCVQVTQCSGASDLVCEPDQGVCATFECAFDGSKACGAGETCIAQQLGPAGGAPAFGACYRTCTPGAEGGCAADEACYPTLLSPTGGQCLTAGENGPGAACQGSAVQDECAPGYACTGDAVDGLRCVQVCDYFGPASDVCLGAGELCDPGSLCVSGGDVVVSAAPVGGACEAGAVYCAIDVARERPGGMCARDDAGAGGAGGAAGGAGGAASGPGGGDGGPVCRQFCRLSVASDCPAGSACRPLSLSDASTSAYVGLCRPPAAGGVAP
jgi:hypothetical protein